MSNWSSPYEGSYYFRSQIASPQKTSDDYLSQSTFPKYPSSIHTTPSPTKTLSKDVFSDLQLDIEPIETRKILPFPIGKNRLSYVDELAHIPTLRRFSSKSTNPSIYLVLGCLLFEKIIENEAGVAIQERISAALRFLQLEMSISRESSSHYKYLEEDFNAIIEFIRKTKYSLSEPNSSKKASIIIKKFYEMIDGETSKRKAIASLTRAVALHYVMKNPTAFTFTIRDCINNEELSLSEIFNEKLCGVFSEALNFKIELLDVSTLTERVFKTDIYPNKYKTSYEFEATVLVVGNGIKDCEYKAIGYRSKKQLVEEKSSIQELESNYQLQKDPTKQGNGYTVLQNEDPVNKIRQTLVPQNKELVEKYSSPFSTQQSNGSTSKANKEPELVECDFCHAPLRKSDVFENKTCSHRFCVYCLQDADYERRFFCLLLSCHGRMISAEVRQFVTNFDERQKSQEVIPEKPQIKTSPKTEVSPQKPIKSDSKLIACDSCSSKFGEMMLFQNYCGHRLCLNCAQTRVNAYSRFCPSFSCSKLLDQAALLLFLEQFTADETHIMSLTCKACSNPVQFEYQPSSRPDYYKCGSCKTISCVKHGDIMAKCGCFCDKGYCRWRGEKISEGKML